MGNILKIGQHLPNGARAQIVAYKFSGTNDARGQMTRAREMRVDTRCLPGAIIFGHKFLGKFENLRKFIQFGQRRLYLQESVADSCFKTAFGKKFPCTQHFEYLWCSFFKNQFLSEIFSFCIRIKYICTYLWI